MAAAFSLGLSNSFGQALPSAQEIRDKVAETYRAPQRYLISATASLQSPSFTNGIRPIPILIAVEFPDKFRMEGDVSQFGLKGLTQIILDGETAWFFDSNAKQYYKVPRQSKKGTPGNPANLRFDPERPEQTVLYFDQYLFMPFRRPPNPQEDTATLLRTDELSIQGKRIPCYVLQIDRRDFDAKQAGAVRSTWWVDTNRYIVWQEDRAAWIGFPSALERQTTNYDTVLLDEKLPEYTFDFRPPKGARQMPLPKNQPRK